METEHTFIAPEGVYSVTEEHKPTLLNTHLVSTAQNAYPTRLSSIVVRFVPQRSGQGFAHLLGGGKDHKKENDGKSASSSDNPGDDDDSPPPDHGSQGTPTHSPETLNVFSQTPSPIGKKKSVSKPKHNLRTTSSTFVTRLQTAEGLARTLQNKQGDITFVFYNSYKNFFWIEVGVKAKEPLARVSFSAFPTCHDINTFTASSERLDIVIGFNTGDLIWFEPMSARYARINKQGSITNSPCTSVHWVPKSPSLFLVSYADGSIVVYDKERDDGVFSPQEPGSSSGRHPSSNGTTASPALQADDGSSSIPSDDANSSKEWNPHESIFVTRPRWHPVTAGQVTGGKGDKDKMPKNPVSHWRVARRSVVDFAFSPDVKYIAAISEDGCVRIIDALAEQLVDCYASYFGSLTCVAWSPDGRFILTGGQDDLVTILSPMEQRVIARCQGHSSFVSALAFDDLRCDGRTYRFGSVGEDNKLILWDFSSGSLHRPKLQHTRHPMASSLSLALRRRGDAADASALHLPPAALPDGSPTRYHPAPSRNEVAVAQPVLSKQVEGEIMTDVLFLSNALLTVTKTGHIKYWVRPLPPQPRRSKHGHGHISEKTTT